MNWLAVPAMVGTGVARWFGLIPMLLTHEKAMRTSWLHDSQRARVKPCSKMPQRK